MPPVPYEKVLGENLKVARVRAGLSQADVAARMQALGFTSWLSQTVSATERARRRATAVEIAGLSRCLETTVSHLVYPDDGDRMVSMPSGFAFPGRELLTGDGSLTWKGNEPVYTEVPPQDVGKLAVNGARLLEQAIDRAVEERLRKQGDQ